MTEFEQGVYAARAAARVPEKNIYTPKTRTERGRAGLKETWLPTWDMNTCIPI